MGLALTTSHRQSGAPQAHGTSCFMPTGQLHDGLSTTGAGGGVCLVSEEGTIFTSSEEVEACL